MSTAVYLPQPPPGLGIERMERNKCWEDTEKEEEDTEQVQDNAPTEQEGEEKEEGVQNPEGGGAQDVESELSGQKAAWDNEEEYRTTIMLRNIPNKYSTKMLLDLIDSKEFEGTYDFFYLPMDFINKCGKGYCFVNFREPKDAVRCTQAFDKFNEWIFKSIKVCAATFAVVQGLKNNCEKMRGSPVVTDTSIPDEYKPIIIGKDGSHTVLGKEYGASDLDGAKPTMSPYADVFVPQNSSQDIEDKDYFRKLICQTRKRPATKLDKKYEIIFDVQIKHDPVNNVFPINEHLLDTRESKMKFILHKIRDGILDIRLKGSGSEPLHLAVGADTYEAFEKAKKEISDHLQSIYQLFTNYIKMFRVSLDEPLVVRTWPEKTPEEPYVDSDPDTEEDEDDDDPIIDTRPFIKKLEEEERRKMEQENQNQDRQRVSELSTEAPSTLVQANISKPLSPRSPPMVTRTTAHDGFQAYYRASSTAASSYAYEEHASGSGSQSAGSTHRARGSPRLIGSTNTPPAHTGRTERTMNHNSTTPNHYAPLTGVNDASLLHYASSAKSYELPSALGTCAGLGKTTTRILSPVSPMTESTSASVNSNSPSPNGLYSIVSPTSTCSPCGSQSQPQKKLDPASWLDSRSLS